ncbi:MAG: hypothetical protein NUV69_01910 [Candidatus Curtissbacteria bacterium]|nr:hypothetical protein [Candidatus Curtissbacteria bacterium]
MTNYQQKQIEVINKIEKQVNGNSLRFSTVSPVEDYENDNRQCLTSVHIPNKTLKEKIQTVLTEPLQAIEPDYYYYLPDSLHLTIKNVRVINEPAHFDENDILKVEKVFSETIPKYKEFNVYFYRLLLFPNSLALIGTTDEELDDLVLDLDKKLSEAGVPDDKKYSNLRYFFCNMTLARFSQASKKFKQKVEELSDSIDFEPYAINSVTLLTCNAAFKKRHVINTWSLK